MSSTGIYPIVIEYNNKLYDINIDNWTVGVKGGRVRQNRESKHKKVKTRKIKYITRCLHK